MNWKGILAVVVIILIIESIAFFAYVNSGKFNLAVGTPYPPGMIVMLEKARDESILKASKNVLIPADFEAMSTSRGARIYKQVCINCHGEPGKDATKFGKALDPVPPDLRESGEEMNPEPIFWIIKNGIKMTGMPAVGKLYKEEDLWSITAFIKKLPLLYPEKTNHIRGSDHHHGGK